MSSVIVLCLVLALIVIGIIGSIIFGLLCQTTMLPVMNIILIRMNLRKLATEMTLRLVDIFSDNP